MAKAMKKSSNFKPILRIVGITVLAVIIGFSLVCCGGGGGSGNTATYTGKTKDGKTTYTLKISKAARAITPEIGDDYTLTVSATGAKTKTSTGTVDNVNGDELTLRSDKSGETFKAGTKGANGLDNIIGLITFDDGTDEEGPGELTPSGGGSGGGGNTPSGGNGTFTLTGIPSKYNGKYAYLITMGDGNDPMTTTFSLMGMTSLTTQTLPRISNGSVSIPLWKVDLDTTNYKTPTRYSGNDTIFAVLVNVYETSNISGTLIGQAEFTEVTFKNGGAARNWDEAVLTRE